MKLEEFKSGSNQKEKQAGEIQALIDGLSQKKEEKEEDLNENNKINKLNSTDLKNEIYALVDIEREKNNLTQKKNNLTENIKPAEIRNTGEVIDGFIAEYDFINKLPEGFNDLPEANKFFVIQNLKRKIVDIVKSDGETQYSDYIKDRIAPNYGSLSKIPKFFKSLKRNLKESVLKKSKIDDFTNEAFDNLKNTEAGKKLITEQFELLTENAKDQKIKYDVEKNIASIVYINTEDKEVNYTTEERKSIDNFNMVANKFKDLPYEWGYEKKSTLSGHRRKYTKVKEQYEQAKAEILNIKREKNGKESAMVEMLGIDFNIGMQQRISTHPEFEKELTKITEGPDSFAEVKSVASFLKNMANKDWKVILLAGGMLMRGAARGAGAWTAPTGVTLALTPIIGGVTGYFRGRYRAKDTLLEKHKKTRSRDLGTKEEERKRLEKQKGEINVVNATDLTKRLDTLSRKLSELQTNPNYLREHLKEGSAIEINERRMHIQTIFPDGRISLIEAPRSNKEQNNSINIVEKNKDEMIKILEEDLVGQIKRRIEYTQRKIEEGLVNFGTTKLSLNNELRLSDSLNTAMVNSVMLDGSVKKEVEERLERFFMYKKIGIDKVEKEFLDKQSWEGAKMGAKIATGGYLLKYILEGAPGLFGGEEHGATEKIVVSKIPEKTPEGIEPPVEHIPTEDTSGIKPIETPEDTSVKVEKNDDWFKIEKHENNDIPPTPKSEYDDFNHNTPIEKSTEKIPVVEKPKIETSPEKPKIDEKIIDPNKPGTYRGYNAPKPKKEDILPKQEPDGTYHGYNAPKVKGGGDINVKEPQNIPTAEEEIIRPEDQFTGPPTEDEYGEPVKLGDATKTVDDTYGEPSHDATVDHQDHIELDKKDESIGPPTEDEYGEPVQIDDATKTVDDTYGEPVNTEPLDHQDHIEPVKKDEFIGPPKEDEYGEPIKTQDTEIEYEKSTETPKILNEDKYEEPIKATNPILETTDNPYNLSEETLKKINKIYGRIDYKFYDYYYGREQMWDLIKRSSAPILMEDAEHFMKGADSTWYLGDLDKLDKKFLRYLYKLKKETGLTPIDPHPADGPGETIKEYLKRALQKAAKMGKLNKFRF